MKIPTFWSVLISVAFTFGNFVALMMAGFWLEPMFPVAALISVVVLITDFRYWYMLGHGGIPNVLVTLAWYMIGFANTTVFFLFVQKFFKLELNLLLSVGVVYLASAALFFVKLWCANNYANLMEERASA